MSVQRPSVVSPDVELHQFFTQGPRVLRRSWFLATFVGVTLALLVPGLVATVALELHPAAAITVIMLAGAVGGAILGVTQSVVLDREFLGFSRSSWIATTALGASMAWLVATVAGMLGPAWTQWPLFATVPLGLGLALVLLLSLGYGQAVVLGRHVARSRTWAAANAAAWSAGLGLLLAVCAPLWGRGLPVLLLVVLAALGGLAASVTVSLLTGLWLVRLVCPPEGSPSPRQGPTGVPRQDWAALARSTDHFGVFDPTAMGHLPDPVQRWLRHVLTPGATLLAGVETEANGHIRLAGAWRGFHARQRSTLDGGYLWSGRSRVFGLSAVGCDRYTREQGEVRWRLPGRMRLLRDVGENATRSAAARHALDLLASVPAVALDPAVRWEEVDHDHATAHIRVDDEDQAVTVTVDPVGRLCQVEVDRWGMPGGSEFGPYRYGAVLGEERSFDGYLVPTEVVAGWHIGSEKWGEGSMLRYRVVRCSFH